MASILRNAAEDIRKGVVSLNQLVADRRLEQLHLVAKSTTDDALRQDLEVIIEQWAAIRHSRDAAEDAACCLEIESGRLVPLGAFLLR